MLLFASSVFLLAKPPLAQAQAKPNGLDFNNGTLTISGTNGAQDIYDFITQQGRDNIQKVVFDVNTVAITNSVSCPSLFENCNNLQYVTTLAKVSFPSDQPYTSSLKGMFSGCHSLREVNLEKFDTSNVNDMSNMFYNIGNSSYSTNINISSFDTTHVTNMVNMFRYWPSGGSIGNMYTVNLSSFNTSALQNQTITEDGKIKTVSGAYGMLYLPELGNITLGSQFSFPASPLDSSDFFWDDGCDAGLLATPGAWFRWKTDFEGNSIVPLPSLYTWQNNHLGAIHQYILDMDSPDPDPTPAEPGWQWTDDGWKYVNEDGLYDTNEWSFIDGSWYYFKDNGSIETGCWAWIEDAWYGFWSNGAMCTGWVWDESYESYFYCGASGRMVAGVWDWIDGAWYGFWSNGTMCRGWIWDSGANGWYYCYNSGVMARNARIGHYYVNNSGRWI